MGSLANNSNNVGEVTGTMGMRYFDDKTRPFERQDLMDYINQTYYTTMAPEEKSIIDRAVYGFLGGCGLMFGAGYLASGRLPWKKMGALIGFPSIHRIGRPMFGLAGCVVPYVYVQQRFLNECNDLPMSYGLSFHVRRMLITQRGAIMFGRSTLREVTREEQESYERVALQVQRDNTKQVTGNSIDVNAELQKQVLLPIAQSGYKAMPPN